jgi:hypothetical protein
MEAASMRDNETTIAHAPAQWGENVRRSDHF